MPILFSAVAYEKNIAAKYASCEGNFMEIAEEVLLKIPAKNHKMTYSHGPYLFHYIVDNEYVYFCITAKACQRSRSFLFLNEIKRRFSPKEGSEFRQVLADEMYRYSEDYSTITIRKGELDEINSIGVGCSESILGEKILFVNNPEELSYTTVIHVNEPAQTPAFEILETKESRDNVNIVLESLDKDSKDNQESFSYYLIVTVILVVIWLIMSMFGPISLVMVACICILVISKLPKGKSES